MDALKRQNLILAKSLKLALSNLNSNHQPPLISSGHRLSTTSSSLVLTKSDLDLHLKAFKDSVSKISLEIKGIPPFVYGNIAIGSLEDAKMFVQSHCPVDCLDLFPSVFIMLCSVGKTMSDADANTLEVAADRLQRTTSQQNIINFRKRNAPDVFKGDAGGVFSALKTFRDWDGSDAKTGVINTIKQHLTTWEHMQKSLIASQIGDNPQYEQGKNLALYLIEHVKAYVESLRSEITKAYTVRLTRLAGGVESVIKADHREAAWSTAKQMLESIFRKVSLVSLQASHGGSVRSVTDRSALFLWVSIQEHQVWTSYGSHASFSDHKDLQTSTLQHLEENLFPKGTAEKELSVITKRLSSLESDLSTATKTITKLSSVVGNIKDDNNNKRGGGRGAGGKRGEGAAAGSGSDS